MAALAQIGSGLLITAPQLHAGGAGGEMEPTTAAAAATLQTSCSPAAELVKRACYCAGAVDGVLKGTCKVALQATGAAAEAAGDRLAERSAHLVTSAYVAAGASAGERVEQQLHCLAPERHLWPDCAHRGWLHQHCHCRRYCPPQGCTRAASGR